MKIPPYEQLITLTKSEEKYVDRWLDSILIDPITKPIVSTTGKILIEILITQRINKFKQQSESKVDSK